MIRIAPISSPWTTRSAQNQAAWNVSQTVKPMSNHVRPFELRETQEDLSRKWGQSRRIPFRADGIVVDCPVDQVLCLWFRGTTPVPCGFAGAPVREPCCQMLFVHLITRSCNQVCWQLLLPRPLCKSCKGKKVPGGETRPLPSQAQHILQTDRTRSVEYNGMKFYTLELLQFFEGVFDLQVLVRAAFVRVRAGATRRNLSDSALCSCVIHQRLADYDPSVASLKWCRWPSLAAGMGFQTFLSRIVKKNTEERSSHAWRNIQCSIRSPPRSAK